ncbi:MAG: hypothetical protein AAGA91_12935 [Pseudomonadota bacterium]
MRTSQWTAIIAALVISGSASAYQETTKERVKSGILPAGGFYSLYEVTCSSGDQTAIASMERRTRWCAESSGELTCFRTIQEAKKVACTSDSVAMRASTAIESSEDPRSLSVAN